MMNKTLWSFVGIALFACSAFLSNLCIAADRDKVEFSVLYRRAYQDLKQGKYSEALNKILSVEDAVKKDLKNNPGRVINILMIRSKIYSLQMAPDGLENFLTNFEQEFADTSISHWVQQVADSERVFCYRLVGDLQKAAEASEQRLRLYQERIRLKDKNELSYLFSAHVQMVKDVGDLYRFMGNTDLALERYEQALQYLKDHPELVSSLEPKLKKKIGKGLFPSIYEHIILPGLIRECQLIISSPPGILCRQVAWEAEQANYLLELARVYSKRQICQLALERYQRAQQVLELNEGALNTLEEKDKERLAKLQETLSQKINMCREQLVP